MESVCPNNGNNYIMMSFPQFCEEVRKGIEERFEDCEATLRNVTKNNGTEYCGITIRRGEEAIMPTIYLEEFYEEFKQGSSLTGIVNTVAEVYEANRNPWPDGLDFAFDAVKDKITFRLVNYEKNAQLLAGMPHICFDEWAICFDCLISQANGNIGAVRVDEAMCREWKVSLSDLTRLAAENSFRLIPSTVDPIEVVLATLLMRNFKTTGGEDEREKAAEVVNEVLREKNRCGLPMYVLSNAMNHFGATAILNIPFMDGVREKLKEDFYILPSSVHELILVPVSAAPAEDRLLEMVREVNQKEVPESDFLADGVYRYGVLRKKITRALSIPA